MMKHSSVTCTALFAVLCAAGVGAVYRLEPLSTIYVPYAYSGLDGLYDIDAAAVEQSVYDKDSKLLYAAGDNYIHIIDLSVPSLPRIIDYFILNNRANDIETCGGYVAYVVEGSVSQSDGHLVVRGKYNTATGLWPEYNTILVGSKPDMLKFTHDCSIILTANEGEAAEVGSLFVNPEGSVSIVRNFATVPSVNTLDFTSFNAFASYYESIGVRAPYKGQLAGDVTNTFSQNMEPEYIAISTDDTTAYICLQENNAIAEVDIATNTIVELIPLGTKSWGALGLDASDEDGKIATKNYDIFSLYQPDAIKIYHHLGQDYIITANEGDSFEYTFGADSWDEAKRGNNMHDDGDLSQDILPSLELYMNDKNDLGRLEFSKFDGLDSSGDVLNPTFFGARGVSVFKPLSQSLERVWDSADEVERVVAQYYPATFNGNTKPNDKYVDRPIDQEDSRSDNLGPECESIEIGHINGQDYAFIGVDRSAVILVYRITTGVGGPSLVFESVFRAGGITDTYQELLDQRNLGNLDPEDLKFVSASDSATGNPLLIVTSTVSGTVAVHQIINQL